MLLASTCSRCARTALFAGLAGPFGFAAGEEPAKDYVAFVGINVTVVEGDAQLPVVGARRAGVDVMEQGRVVSMSSRDLHEFTTTVEPKVSAINLKLTDVRGEPTYTRANDPNVHLIEQQSFLYDLQDARRSHASTELIKAQRNVLESKRLAETGVTIDMNKVYGDASVAEAEFNAEYSDASAGRIDASVMQHDGNAAYDAFDLSFRVSTPHPIAGAYAVLRLFIRQPRHPNEKISLLKFLPLPELGPKERKLGVWVRGLPSGYTLDAYELHFFIGNRELATTVSRNRFEVTKSEAHQFLILRYVTEHKLATAPAAIVSELVPAELRDLVRDDWKSWTVDFTIDADGNVTHLAFAGGQPPPSADLEETLRTLRFYPALVHGVPTASEGTFALSEFLR